MKSKIERKSEPNQEAELGVVKSSRRILKPSDKEVSMVAAFEEEDEVSEAAEDHMVDNTEASQGEAVGMAEDSGVKAAMVRSLRSHSAMGLSRRRYDTERAVQLGRLLLLHQSADLAFAGLSIAYVHV